MFEAKEFNKRQKIRRKLLENAGISKEETQEFLVTLSKMIQRMIDVCYELEIEDVMMISNEEIDHIIIDITKEIQGVSLTENQMVDNVNLIVEEFGYIKNKKELKTFIDEVNILDFLMYFYLKLFKMSGNEANLVDLSLINLIYGYSQDKLYNFFTEKDKNIYIFMKLLELRCNPYKSEYVYSHIKKRVQLNGKENKKEIFKSILKVIEFQLRDIRACNQKGTDYYLTTFTTTENPIVDLEGLSVFNDKTIFKK